ncbi:MAG: hypothetical protein J6H21_01675 [Firmicutes bacterium]|nr:hypothetical protein [Bacillota bacterium]
MKKRNIIVLFLITIFLLSSCGSKGDSQPAPADESQESAAQEEEAKEEENKESAVASSDEMVEVEDVVEDWMVPIYAESLKEGTYPITVSSSSSMFKIEGGELTVKDGELTVAMTMGGKGYRYLYMGTGEEAVDAPESEYIPYQENADGAHVYTVPIEALDQGVPCAAFSNKKEKWYDRTLLYRSDSLPLEAFKDELIVTAAKLGLEDGEYSVDVSLNGGTGRTSVESPCKIKVEGDSCIATIVWSSDKYDYMIVDGEKYLPINTEGNSTFEIPVKVFDRAMAIIGDTIAMSEPHEIDYTLIFDSKSIK